MAVIAPTRKDIEHPDQIKRNSAPLRVWHWANTIVISGALITVLINSTITNTRQVSSLIKSEVQKLGVTLTDSQARAGAHALSDKVWGIHVYFGYCLAGLLLFRLLLEFFHLADQKFIRKFKSAYKQFIVTKKNREIARHELAVKIIYALFYVLLIIQVVTGLCLAFEDIAFLKPFRHFIREVHGFCMYLFLAFIIVHITGVFLAERKGSKGIVSDMINGGRQEN